jgi:predicted RNA-binding protein YlxR (DUF448 family)
MPFVRPRQQPQRTCVSCRETQDKRTLIRLVRAPAGPEGSSVTVDERGRANGRGAYLCTSADCWRRALRSGSLARALNTQLSPHDRQTLEAYLERLTAGAPQSVALAPREGSPA